MYIPVLIVGSGIAGMSVAYNLSKENIDNIVINKEDSYFKSNSTIAPANMRFFKNPFEGIELYMSQCNGNFKTINSIYSNQSFLVETLEELNVKLKQTPIGVMPQSDSELGGQVLLKKMYCYIKNMLTSTQLLDIKKNEKHIECLLYNKQEKFIHINCNAIVFATGGFASIFEQNDNANCATGECIYIIQKETNKLRGISTIMFHPFGIEEGKRVLTGDVVSCIENIYYKSLDGNFKLLNLKPEILDAIKSNKYHSNEMFNNILASFCNKEVYLKFNNKFDLNLLKQHHLNKIILANNMLKINPTAHYTSGGVVVDENFKVDDKIFANGEIVFDGNKGIGRIPGHAFTSSIIGGKLISNEIKKMKFEKIDNKTNFDIEKKLAQNDESNLLKAQKVFDKLLKKTQNALHNDIDKNELEKEIKYNIELIYKGLKSIKELYIYYRLNLLYEIVKDLK